MKNQVICQDAHPVCNVADISKSLAFYNKKLGFQEVFRNGDTYAIIKRDAAEIHLFAPNHRLLSGQRACGIRVTHIGTLYKAYLEAGVTLVRDFRQQDHMHDFITQDIDGNQIVFFELLSEIES